MEYNISFEMLLHPELLPNEVLIHILHQRQVKIQNIDQMPRDTLLELFHQYCTPHSQRKYRDNARGKILNENRNMNDYHKDLTNTSQSQFLAQNLRSLHLEKCDELSDIYSSKPSYLVSKVKKIKLSNSPPRCTTQCYGADKRKNNYHDSSKDISPPEKRRRTAITWP